MFSYICVMKHIFFISILSLICSTAFSQQHTPLADSLLLKDDVIVALQEKTEGEEGLILINQDSRIHYLVNKHIKLNESEGTIKGWRIQIYNSSGKESREQAKRVKEKFLNKYPEVNAYLIYQPPYFKIRVGNFRTKQEGFEFYKQIAKTFPILYFVPDNIVLPEME